MPVRFEDATKELKLFSNVVELECAVLEGSFARATDVEDILNTSALVSELMTLLGR